MSLGTTSEVIFGAAYDFAFYEHFGRAGFGSQGNLNRLNLGIYIGLRNIVHFHGLHVARQALSILLQSSSRPAGN